MAITITPGTPVIPDEFTDLGDVPSDYTGESGKLVAVNGTEDGLEFITGSGGAVDSVNTQTGVVVLDSDDIAEGATNLYATAASVGAIAHGASGKTTPVDADTMPLIDSAASNVLKKVTWANIKATLKTYLDTLYGLLGSANTWTAINTFDNDVIAGIVRRATETSSLTLMGGTSTTQGPYISLMGKDVGGSDDGTIRYFATTESSAVGEHKFFVDDGASALLRARVTIDGIVTTGVVATGIVATGIDIGEARVGGTMYANGVFVANSGTTETNLHVYTVPANTLVADGDKIVYEAYGVFAATGNTKTLRLYANGTVVATWAPTINDGTWRARIVVSRRNSTNVYAAAHVHGAATPPSAEVGIIDFADIAVTFSGTFSVGITGQSSGGGETGSLFASVKYHPVNT